MQFKNKLHLGGRASGVEPEDMNVIGSGGT